MTHRGFAMVALHAPQKNVNVGGVLRAAFAFGCAGVVIGGGSAKIRHPADTSRAWRRMPIFRASDVMDAIPFNTIPIAIEFTEESKNLAFFAHPERAFYIFGPESGDVPPRIIKRCKETIKIPSRYCLNLAAAVNITLYDRIAKDVRQATRPDNLQVNKAKTIPARRIRRFSKNTSGNVLPR